ncbi:Cytochrome oxidase maturation protein cbb3-type [compost metagenome]
MACLRCRPHFSLIAAGPLPEQGYHGGSIATDKCQGSFHEHHFVLIPIAILFVIIAGAVFFWAIRSEQFEDLDRQGSNILFDEEQPANKSKDKPRDDQQP